MELLRTSFMENDPYTCRHLSCEVEGSEKVLAQELLQFGIRAWPKDPAWPIERSGQLHLFFRPFTLWDLSGIAFCSLAGSHSSAVSRNRSHQSCAECEHEFQMLRSGKLRTNRRHFVQRWSGSSQPWACSPPRPFTSQCVHALDLSVR